MIQESKYLGGDMEHTHLVKGLDYALLEKVKAEITSKEVEEEEMETVVKQKPWASFNICYAIILKPKDI